MNCLVCAQDIHDVFYTSFDMQGNMDLYCFSCYSKTILDNYPGMIPMGHKVSNGACECGTKANLGQNHSNWCKLFRKEFK